MNQELHDRYERCVLATTPTMGADVAKHVCVSSVYGSRGLTSEKKNRTSQKRTTQKLIRKTQRRRRGSSYRRKN